MKKWLVALQTGGLMEDPEIRYQMHEVIEAETESDARAIYNKKHNCSFYYGMTFGELIEDKPEEYTLKLTKFFNKEITRLINK